jgi:LmbE family N-acetylglucosaminyl deacetylase
MRLPVNCVLLLILCCGAGGGGAQTPQMLHGADDRYKADILIVVAHPDDEAFFTPYAVKAMNDMHKSVAVIFSTRGGSGANRFTRERGPAMANEREIEAREACAKLGIHNVWFLDGKDSASQNVLDSLSSWGHGGNLEKLVGLLRLTRPEVILTHHPGVFIGENHGDHQATGILVLEAFDLAGNPAVFPAQLSGDMTHYESYLSNLQPWQAKKIYVGSDADDGKQFDGSGPTYSPREISPSLKKPYWRVALDSAMSHKTQFPEDIERMSNMTEEQLEKVMSDPNTGWWPEPSTLIFAKSVVGGAPTDPVFAHLDDQPVNPASQVLESCDPSGQKVAWPHVELGGPWQYYAKFYPAHGLCQLKVAKIPEIGVTSGSALIVPVVVRHEPSKPAELSLSVTLPEGWKVKSSELKFTLPAETATALSIHLETPALSAEQLKRSVPQEIRLAAEVDGQPAGGIILRVALKAGGLPQSL